MVCKKCQCLKCCNLVFTQNVSIVSGVLVLNIPQATYKNAEQVCIMLMQNLPVTENIMPVAITIGDETTQYILMNCNGNAIYSDQLKFKNIYPTTVRTDMKVFKYNGSRLPSTKFNFMTI